MPARALLALAAAVRARAAVPNWQSWAWMDYNSSEPCHIDDPHHCYGNGNCTADGLCLCDIGWRGAYCSQLDLLPARRGAHGLPLSTAMPTWGGSAAWDGARWHFVTGAKLFNLTLTPPAYGEWNSVGHIEAPGLDQWGRTPPYNQTALVHGGDPFDGTYPWSFTTTKDPYAEPEDNYGPSYLVRMLSTGTDPAGPYAIAEVMHKAFRADFKRRHGDGDGDPLYMLTIGTVLGEATGRGMLIMRSVSGNVTGPWTKQVVYNFEDNGHGSNFSAWDCDVKDPSFAIHANGTTVIAYRAVCCDPCGDHTERIGLLVADSWEGPYTRIGEPIFDDSEDLFMWITERGTHMIFHSQNTDHGTIRGEGSTYGADHKKKRGGYAFSADGVVRWSKSDWELFPAEIAWDDGTTQFLLKQQRPSLVFDPFTSRPTHLVTGVDSVFDPCCSWYIYGSAWTLVQPLVTACAAGTIPDGASGGACIECTAADIGCGRCEQATTKYGACVCATCAVGWRGDSCEERELQCLTGVDGAALDAATDAGFSSRHHCDGGRTEDRVTLIATAQAPSLEACAAACDAYVRRWNQLGCCYSFQGASKTCQFTPGASITVNNGALRYAAQCVRPNATTISVDTCLPPPSPPPPALPLPHSPPSSPSLPPPPAVPPSTPPPMDGAITCTTHLAAELASPPLVANAMTWAYVDIAPLSAIELQLLADVVICASLYHDGGVGNAANLRARMSSGGAYSSAEIAFLFDRPAAGGETNLTAACWSDMAAAPLPRRRPSAMDRFSRWTI